MQQYPNSNTQTPFNYLFINFLILILIALEVSEDVKSTVINILNLLLWHSAKLLCFSHNCFMKYFFAIFDVKLYISLFKNLKKKFIEKLSILL